MATKLQILQDHCREFEQKLETCESEEQARQARTAACERLGTVCQSEMMQEMLAEHAAELIRARFG